MGNKFDKAVFGALGQGAGNDHYGGGGIRVYIGLPAAFSVSVLHEVAQSTLFGPLKYAILPTIIDDKELMMGNSLIESGTFVAIWVRFWERRWQVYRLILSGYWFCWSPSEARSAACYAVCTRKAADTQIEWNIVRGTKSLLSETVRHKPVFYRHYRYFVVLVCRRGLYHATADLYPNPVTGGNDNVFNLMLALFSIGIAHAVRYCVPSSAGNG